MQYRRVTHGKSRCLANTSSLLLSHRLGMDSMLPAHTRAHVQSGSVSSVWLGDLGSVPSHLGASVSTHSAQLLWGFSERIQM